MRQDRSVLSHRVKKGTARRMLTFAVPYKKILAVFVPVVILGAVIAAVNPLILRALIEQRDPEEERRPGRVAGAPGRRSGPVRWRPRTGRAPDLRLYRRVPHLRHAGEGLPSRPADAAAFFSRTQTGALVSRLEQRRDRHATGLHRPPLQRGGEPRDRRDRDRRHVLPELADHPGRIALGAPFLVARSLRGSAHRRAHQGGLRPQLRDEHGHAGALPGWGRHARQTDGTPRGRSKRLSRPRRDGYETSGSRRPPTPVSSSLPSR